MERGEPDAAAHETTPGPSAARSVEGGEAVFHMNLGILEAIRSRVGAARDSFVNAAAVYSSMNNSRGRAMVLRRCHLGSITPTSGKPRWAEEQSLEALALYRQMGESRGEAQCLSNLASIAAEEPNCLKEGASLASP